MPLPPGIARRHRWFIAVIVVLLVVPTMTFWTPLPLLVSAVAAVLVLPALLVWIAAGQSWVWAAGPPRPADAVDEARRVGRRMMVTVFVFRLVVEAILLAFSARGDQRTGETVVRPIVTGAVLAFMMGKFAEYLWARRPAGAPVPWIFRVWRL